MKMCALLLILDCHCLLSEVKANFVYYSYPLHILSGLGFVAFLQRDGDDDGDDYGDDDGDRNGKEKNSF